MYRDESGVPHPTPSVELYIPWNNTWVFLPSLPSFTYWEPLVADQEFSAFRPHQVNMTVTHLFSLNIRGGNMLYLLGGSAYDWASPTQKHTSDVWRLEYNQTSRGYYWFRNDFLYPPTGQYFVGEGEGDQNVYYCLVFN